MYYVWQMQISKHFSQYTVKYPLSLDQSDSQNLIIFSSKMC